MQQQLKGPAGFAGEISHPEPQCILGNKVPPRVCNRPTCYHGNPNIMLLRAVTMVTLITCGHVDGGHWSRLIGRNGNTPPPLIQC